MAKLQMSAGSKERLSLNIPKELTDYLGWKIGDHVLLKAEIKTNKLVVYRVVDKK